MRFGWRDDWFLKPAKMMRFSLPTLGIVMLCLLVAVTEAEYMKYKDPKQPLNTRIKELLGRMTIEEKIGQMVQIDRQAASADVMKKYFIGFFKVQKSLERNASRVMQQPAGFKSAMLADVKPETDGRSNRITFNLSTEIIYQLRREGLHEFV